MILDKLAASTRLRVEADKKKLSPDKMKEKALSMPKGSFAFENQLKKPGIHFICEVKKASPSKGVIAEEFPYLQIAKVYEVAGADCISVLTEPEYFMGKDEYLAQIKQEVSIPVLRKDFTVDEYQIYQAKTLHADCILLICSLLSEEEIRRYIRICDTLGLSALVETHDEQEIQMAVRAGARMLGVNNRNLKTFEVDIHNSERLRAFVPSDILFVAESGIKTRLDIEVLEQANVNGVLIGETLMRSPNKKTELDKLKGIAV